MLNGLVSCNSTDNSSVDFIFNFWCVLIPMIIKCLAKFPFESVLIPMFPPQPIKSVVFGFQLKIKSWKVSPCNYLIR